MVSETETVRGWKKANTPISTPGEYVYSNASDFADGSDIEIHGLW